MPRAQQEGIQRMLSHSEIDRIVLQAGSHKSPADGFCVMELAAYIAGEPFSDQPACVSRVLGAFLRKWDDDLDDAGRQRLKPYVPIVIGTSGNMEADERRAWMAADWLVRVHTPAWLRLAKLNDQARALELLPEFTCSKVAFAARPTLELARQVADAARDTTGYAVRFEAMTAAGYAARYSAGAAAMEASFDAATEVAARALTPTKLSLQDSTLLLLNRMIAVGQARRDCGAR
jgi:hypothetical protein